MPGESFDLDRALLGSDVCDDVPLRVSGREIVVSVRPLSRAEVSRLGLAVEDLSRNDAATEALRSSVRHRVLHLACAIAGGPAFDTPDEVGEMPADVVAMLWAALLRVHARAHHVSVDASRAMDDYAAKPAFHRERLRAHHAATICAFFGLPRATDATAVQVEWIARLMEKPK